MQAKPDVDFSHVHPPTTLKFEKAGRYLSADDEIRLVSLLHAVLHAQEDYRFSWPKKSRGQFTMKFTPNSGDEEEVIFLKFAGDDPYAGHFRTDWFNLMTDDDDNFDIKVEIIPPEVSIPKSDGWHALCLAKNLEHELSYATLCFLERLRPDNEKLQRCIKCEKDMILGCNDYEYNTRSIWVDHLNELERCVKDAMNGGRYAPLKSCFGIWRIPQEYRNYRAWFLEQR